MQCTEADININMPNVTPRVGTSLSTKGDRLTANDIHMYIEVRLVETISANNGRNYYFVNDTLHPAFNPLLLKGVAYTHGNTALCPPVVAFRRCFR